MSTRVMTTWSLKIFLELQNGRKTKNSAIYHFHIDHNANCFPPSPPPPPHQKKMHNRCLIVLISWDDCNIQEKLQPMIMQKLGVGGGGRG